MDVARRLRQDPRLRQVRQHLPLLTGVAALAVKRRHPVVGRGLAAVSAAGFGRTYMVNRRLGKAATAEHVERMRRLRPAVLQHFYITCIGSMEAELEEFPAYDQRKHEQRYSLVAEQAIAHTPEGGKVVDVGCASALVLDRLHAVRGGRS